MARSGVMPTPPASSSAGRGRERAGKNAPNGPSASTRVPGRSERSMLLGSPTSRTVIRIRSSLGSADSEYGCDCHHSPRVRNRQRKNWPGAASSSPRSRPLM